jgi:hypothetical protein
MFPTALFTIAVPISPIRDVKGDATVHIISTPNFCVSPAPAPAPEPKISKLCMRLFEDSTMSPTIIMTDFKVDYSSNWTTDSDSGSDSESDWSGSADISDSDSESELETEPEPESEFRWSATP